MPITAAVSAAEVQAQVNQRFVNKYIEALLVDAAGITYTPGVTNDTNFLSNEVAVGTGGYDRVVFIYQPADQTTYADGGVGLATKGSIFAHDGGTTSMPFTHAALVWGSGNVASLDAATSDPSAGNDGLYTDIPTVTTGGGTGLFVDVTVNNDVFVFTPSKFGRGYQTGDVVTVTEADLVSAGAVALGAGGAAMQIGAVSSNTESGQIIAVAQTDARVTLGNGEEAAFYWDLKLFGFD
jgi:hypothetical protein|tara:strand:- start:1009 stop:1722 length:714 start_codon:yes stop_codon:yes gene_type:complete